jgi:hypothetical protein
VGDGRAHLPSPVTDGPNSAVPSEKELDRQERFFLKQHDKGRRDRHPDGAGGGARTFPFGSPDNDHTFVPPGTTIESAAFHFYAA